MSEKSSNANASSRKERVSGVSAKILEILATGRMTTNELTTQGGFSTASAFLNLKKLKESGAITIAREGRAVYNVLASPTETPEPAVTRRGRTKGSKNGFKSGVTNAVKKAVAPVAAEGSLKSALVAIAKRFAPVSDLDRKLEVLDQLSVTLPKQVGVVLKEIRSDLLRAGS